MTPSQEQLLLRVLEEDMHYDRSFWERLTPNERQWVIDTLQDDEYQINMNALWEIDYVRRPPSIQEAMTTMVKSDVTGEQVNYYFGPDFSQLYPFWRREMEVALSQDSYVFEHILTGPIGGGKTTYSVFANAYKLILMSCLRNPHKYYGMMESAPIVFSMFNVTMARADLSAYTMFRDIVNKAPYFRDHFPVDRRRVINDAADDDFKYAIKLPNNIKIILGAKPDSAISANVIGGILDEVNFKELKTAVNKDGYKGTVAFKLYANVQKRILSRFAKEGRKLPGILCNVSSRQSTTDFLEEHIKEILKTGEVCDCMALPHTCGGGKYRITADAIYNIKPREWFSKETFRVMVGTKFVKHKLLAPEEEPHPGCDVVEVPIDFADVARSDIDGLIRDVVGRATYGHQPYLHDPGVINEIRNDSRKNPFPDSVELYSDISTNEAGQRIDVGPSLEDFLIKEALVKHRGGGYEPRHFPHNQRFIHLDLALTSDSVGFAMGTVETTQKVWRANKDGSRSMIIAPRIWFDFLCRIVPVEGKQIDFDKIRQFILTLRDIYKFPILRVSTDRYQSAHLRQLLAKEGFETAIISMDHPKDDNPLAVRHAVVEGHIDMPPFAPFEDEITELYHDIEKRKVDHRAGKSKDVFDAFGGVVCSILMEEDPDALIEVSVDKPEAVMPAPKGNNRGGTPLTTNDQVFGDLITDVKYD